MPKPKRPDFNAPADLLDRLPKTSKPTRNDMLKLLDSLPNYVGSLLNAGANRTIFNAIMEAIRAQKDSAPVRPEAPSRPEQRSEAGSSIAASPLERKIDLDHYGPLLVRPETGRITITHESICALALTSDQARQLAALLEEAAGDVDRDGAVRGQYAKLLEATTE